MTSGKKSVAVIGGGIAGLAAAHRLLELHPQLTVRLYEASGRVGGSLRTENQDGFLLEHGADMFITSEPDAVDLCARIGLADELINTNDTHRRSFVLRRGRLHPIPQGFTLMSPARAWPVVCTRILSLKGKLRLAMEPFVRPRRDHGDESLQSFATRRFGQEAFERLIQPLISGIYTADPARLSMAATMQRFVRLEQEHGSIIAGMRRTRGNDIAANNNASGARYGMFVAPRRGMESLAHAVRARLPQETVQLQTRVEDIQRTEDGKWAVRAGSDPSTFDAVILAASAPQASGLLQHADVTLAKLLSQIPYAGIAVASVAYRADSILHPLDGFGFVVPLAERRRIVAASFSHRKFAGRAPDGHALLRVFVGGACQPELLERDDQELRKLVSEELAELLGARGQPLFLHITRWPKAMPQYHVGHLELVDRIEARLQSSPGLQLAGNALRGVGVPQCIRSGQRAAEQLAIAMAAENATV